VELTWFLQFSPLATGTTCIHPGGRETH